MLDPIQKFLQGIESLNTKVIVDPPAANALMDEFRKHQGCAKVEAWAQEALVNHKAAIEILATSEGADERHAVHARMDGGFEADYGITDPFDLWIHSEKGGYKV